MNTSAQVNVSSTVSKISWEELVRVTSPGRLINDPQSCVEANTSSKYIIGPVEARQVCAVCMWLSASPWT